MRRISFYFPLLALAPIVLQGACGASDDHDETLGANDIAAWEDAYQQTDMGKVDSSGCSGVVIPDKSGFAKRVALTFDDGPNPATTPQVLDILKQYGIKATFFINGKRVTSDAARAVLARILEEGHILANHSQNHLNLKTVGIAKVQEEVQKTHDVILATGATPRYFRFPFGSASCAGVDLVEGYGYAVTGWHIDSADWCFAASGSGHCSQSTFRFVPDGYRDDMVGYVMSQVKSKNGGVLLFHDIHQNTASHLSEVIQKLKDGGFSFVNVDDAAAFPLLNGATPAPTPFVGDSCKSDTECNFTDNGKSGSCHLFTPAGGAETGFCTVACEGYCPDKSGKAPTFCTSLDGGTTGSCVSKADTSNGNCSKIAGTAATTANRFIGSSNASASTAQACLPN
ncbi:MAG: polysaccharide deacetylase family protein [Myxococcales bacterium]|nr:polysaccharide deacetylase family protein [Myxococcales bacterium]